MLVNQSMIENKDKIEDAILGWNTTLGNLKQFGFNNNEAKALSLEHGGISDTAASIQAFRNQKQKNLHTLTTVYKDQRGVLLIGTNYKRILGVTSKDFLNYIT